MHLLRNPGYSRSLLYIVGRCTDWPESLLVARTLYYCTFCCPVHCTYVVNHTSDMRTLYRRNFDLNWSSTAQSTLFRSCRARTLFRVGLIHKLLIISTETDNCPSFLSYTLLLELRPFEHWKYFSDFWFFFFFFSVRSVTWKLFEIFSWNLLVY